MSDFKKIFLETSLEKPFEVSRNIFPLSLAIKICTNKFMLRNVEEMYQLPHRSHKKRFETSLVLVSGYQAINYLLYQHQHVFLRPLFLLVHKIDAPVSVVRQLMRLAHNRRAIPSTEWKGGGPCAMREQTPTDICWKFFSLSPTSFVRKEGRKKVGGAKSH